VGRAFRHLAPSVVRRVLELVALEGGERKLRCHGPVPDGVTAQRRQNR